jgi:hypothetical protein
MVDLEKEMNLPDGANGYQREQSPVSGVASQAANVLGDMLELAELQARLAKSDAMKATKTAVKPAGWLIIGICAALGSLPILTLGLATLLADLTPLTAWMSQLLVGGLVAIISLTLIYFSVRRLRKVTAQFQRSADEFAKNIAWAKVVVRSR